MKKLLIVGYDFHGYIDKLKNTLDDDYEIDLVIHGQIFDYISKPFSRLSYLMYRFLFMQPFTVVSKHAYSIFVFCFSKSFSASFLSSLNTLKKNHYDAVIFVGTRELTPSLVAKVRNRLSSDKWVLYKWDSESRFSLKHLHSSFDSVYSFQHEDCLESGVSYLPNFHCIQSNDSLPEKKYLVSAVSLYSYERYELFMNYLRENNIDIGKVRAHFYSHRTDLVEKSDFIFPYPLGHDEVVSIYKSSRRVFDFTQPNQSGMSQRVLEALASGALVITSNKDAIRYFSKVGLVYDYSTPFSNEMTDTLISRNDRLVNLCYGPNWINYILEN